MLDGLAPQTKLYLTINSFQFSRGWQIHGSAGVAECVCAVQKSVCYLRKCLFLVMYSYYYYYKILILNEYNLLSRYFVWRLLCLFIQFRFSYILFIFYVYQIVCLQQWYRNKWQTLKVVCSSYGNIKLHWNWLLVSFQITTFLSNFFCNPCNLSLFNKRSEH